MKHLRVVRTNRFRLHGDKLRSYGLCDVHVVALSQVASAALRKRLAVKGASLKELSRDEKLIAMLGDLLDDRVDDICLRRGIETNRYFARVVTAPYSE
jgi:hypothetical protein